MDIVQVILLFLLLTVFAGLPYGSYRIGRSLERKALTKALINQLEITYYTGYGDAEKNCREGAIK